MVLSSLWAQGSRPLQTTVQEKCEVKTYHPKESVQRPSGHVGQPHSSDERPFWADGAHRALAISWPGWQQDIPGGPQLAWLLAWLRPVALTGLPRGPPASPFPASVGSCCWHPLDVILVRGDWSLRQKNSWQKDPGRLPGVKEQRTGGLSPELTAMET